VDDELFVFKGEFRGVSSSVIEKKFPDEELSIALLFPFELSKLVETAACLRKKKVIQFGLNSNMIYSAS
jgi:hypothetical protein